MKKNVAILFGGQSPEHDIALKSAEFIINSIDTTRYTVYPIGIDKKTGFWYLQPNLTFPIKLNTDKNNLITLLPDHKLYHVHTNEISEPIDIVFPVLHGRNGEDGTIQGALELFSIPFVGADRLGAALGMDKDVSKRLLREADIPVAPFKVVHVHELDTIDTVSLLEDIGFPCFVKPANTGSSYGISKVRRQEELKTAMLEAFKYDRKILIEAAVSGREVECAVMGNDFPLVTDPCEILIKRDFYDFTAKYDDNAGTEFVVVADIPQSVRDEIKQLAIAAYRCLDCRGLARVDFFYANGGKVYINELNTMPGFTAFSMYPRTWQAAGVEGKELVTKLLEYALEDFDQRQSLLM